MRIDRRRFLAAGPAGLTALLVPDRACACWCPPHAHAHSHSKIPHVKMTREVYACPSGFAWSSQNPANPDSTTFTPSTPHDITVYGTGLYDWAQAGGYFWVSIGDEDNPQVAYGSYAGKGVQQGNSGNPDAWTFSTTETGSTPGSSAITITVSLFANGRCGGTWAHQPVTYS
jgi:hypothetical protein